jgi:hypothetical protein
MEQLLPPSTSFSGDKGRPLTQIASLHSPGPSARGSRYPPQEYEPSVPGLSGMSASDKRPSRTHLMPSFCPQKN